MRALCCLLLWSLAGPSRAQDSEPPAGVTYVIPLREQVSRAQFYFLRRALKEAERARATAVVLDMDTYGGDLQAAVKMVDALGQSAVPTVTFVNRNAGSAGALIALATDRIYMAPVSAIGAAAPVMGSGEDLPEAMNEKTVSYFSKYFRSAAERNGHNPEIAEAFINKQQEVKIGDKIISEKGELLTLSPQEAAEEIGGKRVLAQGVVADLEELAKMAGLPPRFQRVEATGFEHLAFWITALAPVLLLVGIVCGYLEFKTPGFGIPGIVAGVCFVLFFTGHYLAGLAGMEGAAFFVVGLILLLVELLFFPGVTVLAVTGVFMMLGALWWAMVDKYPAQPLEWNLENLVGPLANLAVAMLGAGVGIAVLARFLPTAPGFRRLILARQISGGASLPHPEAPAGVGAGALEVGRRGESCSALRPSGKARFGELWADVIADGEFIEAGMPLEVVAVEGSRVLVRRAG